MLFCVISEVIHPSVNNFDIKQKKSMGYLFYCMPPTPNIFWCDKEKQNTAYFS